MLTYLMLFYVCFCNLIFFLIERTLLVFQNTIGEFVQVDSTLKIGNDIDSRLNDGA